MREFNLPLFMKVKPDALKDLNENLTLYFPDIVGKRVLILTTEGLLQRLETKVTLMLSQLKDYEVVTVETSSYDHADPFHADLLGHRNRIIIGTGLHGDHFIVFQLGQHEGNLFLKPLQ